jgi:hypothetical protein
MTRAAGCHAARISRHERRQDQDDEDRALHILIPGRDHGIYGRPWAQAIEPSQFTVLSSLGLI